MTASFFFLIGASLASFLQVLTKALQEKKPLPFLWRRSFCEDCQKMLKPWQLIPIFSFFFLKGRCFYCKRNIPKEHVFIELLFGLAFLFSYHFHLSLFFFFWLIIALFFSLEDWYFKEISFLPFLFSHLFLVSLALFYEQPLYFTSFLQFSLLFSILGFFLKGKLGLGDWLILLFWSLFLPFQTLLWLLMISCLLALPLAFLKKESLPFIPFLTSALLFVQLL